MRWFFTVRDTDALKSFLFLQCRNHQKSHVTLVGALPNGAFLPAAEAVPVQRSDLKRFYSIIAQRRGGTGGQARFLRAIFPSQKTKILHNLTGKESKKCIGYLLSRQSRFSGNGSLLPFTWYMVPCQSGSSFQSSSSSSGVGHIYSSLAG